jgi:Xaa-Pro aminopeptidase
MKAKIEQVLTLLNEHNIGCWVILMREGKEKSLELLLGKEFIGESAFIFTKEKKIAVVAGYDKDRVEDMEILTYTKGINEVLPGVIQEISPHTISMNFAEHDHTVDSLTHGLFLKFQKMLNEIDFTGEIVSSESFLGELRSVKTAEEIQRIKEAVKVTEEIFDEVPDIIHHGITEKEIVTKMGDMTRRSGCQLAWGDPAVTFGLETELGHRISSHRKLTKEESIHIDFGVKYEGYCSDLQRVFYYGGTPPDEMVKAFDTIKKAQKESVDCITPGKKGYEIDAVARAIITGNGYPEYNHGLGHQIGREVHDGGCILGPLWERYEKNAKKLIKKGNVFTVEPSIYGAVNLGLEDDVVVKRKAEYLSHPQKEIIVIE